jgi:hypothetical protein
VVIDPCVWLTLPLLDCQKKISSARSRANNTITSSVIKLRRIARASASPCPINGWEKKVPPYNTTKLKRCLFVFFRDSSKTWSQGACVSFRISKIGPLSTFDTTATNATSATNDPNCALLPFDWLAIAELPKRYYHNQWYRGTLF